MYIYVFYMVLILVWCVRGFLISELTHFGNFLFFGKNSNMDDLSQRSGKKIVIIVGPTASGKTRFSVDLCKKLREYNVYSELINADSMQVYRGFNVGTAKPSAEELRAVPHHLIDFVDPTEDYNASLFVRDCSRVIEDLFSQNKLPVVVGGTNLYIEALLWPSVIDFENSDEFESLEEQFKEYDSDTLHSMLMQVDPDRAGELHKNDRKRIIRSLDVYHFHGVTHTELMRIRREERDRTGIRYNVLLFLMKADPEIHRRRIRDRVQMMLKDGILDECKQLLALKEANPQLDARRGVFQSIAYKELEPLLAEAGAQPSAELLERCASVLENRTWQYAQRQRSWVNNRLAKHALRSREVDTNEPSRWDSAVEEGAQAVLKYLGDEGS